VWVRAFSAAPCVLLGDKALSTISLTEHLLGTAASVVGHHLGNVHGASEDRMSTRNQTSAYLSGRAYNRLPTVPVDMRRPHLVSN
jgi:hypothetical protein